MKNELIHPKATALWLIKNTKLTFKQIADFCGFESPLAVQEMADGFESSFLEPSNPVTRGQLTMEEIERCELDQKQELRLAALPISAGATIKVAKRSFSSSAVRRNKISGVLFLIDKYKYLPSAAIIKLTGATKNAVEGIINGTYSKLSDIQPKDPVSLGLCSQVSLNEALEKHSPKNDPKHDTK